MAVLVTAGRMCHRLEDCNPSILGSVPPAGGAARKGSLSLPVWFLCLGQHLEPSVFRIGFKFLAFINLIKFFLA